jgi:ABC-type sugar transport system permease subunit
VQRLRFITLPMMQNIISITVLFSLIVTFANYDIVRVLTNGGPRDLTHVFATYAFQVGILSGNIPRGAAVSRATVAKAMMVAEITSSRSRPCSQWAAAAVASKATMSAPQPCQETGSPAPTP